MRPIFSNGFHLCHLCLQKTKERLSISFSKRSKLQYIIHQLPVYRIEIENCIGADVYGNVAKEILA